MSSRFVMNAREDPPELLSTGEVADIFKVARSTVSSWAVKGLLPHIRTPSGRLRFYRSDVERFLDKTRRDSGQGTDTSP
jgi:excisionase family DNA binding protein